MVSIFCAYFCSFQQHFDNLCSLKTLGKARGEEALKWHTFAIAIKNRKFNFLSMTRRRLSEGPIPCNSSGRFCRVSCASFGQLGTKNNTRPYRQMTTEPLSVCNLLQILNTEKGKFLFHRKYLIIHFCICRLRSTMTQDLLSSVESINLYYFNIIKKYTSHMYDLTAETKINLNIQDYFPFLMIT